MSSVFGIRHTSSGSTSHGSDTRRRLSERPEDEVRGKADSSTNELKNNRYTKGAGGRRPPAPFVGRPKAAPLLFFSSLVLLSAFPRTSSSGLSLSLRLVSLPWLVLPLDMWRMPKTLDIFLLGRVSCETRPELFSVPSGSY